ncbi:Retrovirus-related Pol polyprotein from transposon [Zancudomyces culisetae]|uniref:Retrovirus-related Pol polyprotein from transposon n=1 Tax=Zancudomyces culisetae TaxID=1213189 RepID=A0A1R1PD60_ZANCU|nr:Retrovirus-related Pol polyprotein from transposon [Zancudomyces culisetae]|eukprot:OMH78934.1 Retrovirus-related Pol polyprotein from transposon [Zancudomyces culisetae]
MVFPGGTVTQKQDIPSHAEDRIPWARVDNRRNWYQPSKDCSYSEVSKAQFSEGIAVISRTHRNTNWTWDEEKGKAFEQLKEALCSPSTLAHPDWSQEFILTTDASIKGIGGILSESNGGEEKPVCYISRTTNKHEQNYSVTHLEGLAHIWSIKKLKYYLWGRHFTIRTDHKSLIKLFEGSEITGRVARWAIILRNYDYTITHCPGKNNPADAVTRLEQEKIEEPMETIDICTLDYLYYEAIKNYLGTFSYPNNADELFRKKLRAKKELYKELEVLHTPTTAYRPQSNGQVERLNQTLKNTLIKQCRLNKENWDQYIWKSLLAIRTMRNSSTKFSPAELLYGTKIATPSTWTPPPDVDDMDLAIRERIEAIKSDLPALRSKGLHNSIKSKEKDKVRYNRDVRISEFQEGNLVLKKIEQPQSKLEQLWEGPYRVDRKLRLGTYVISDRDGNRDLVHGDLLKHYHQSQEMIPEVSTSLKSKLQRFREVGPIWCRGSVI